MRSCAWATKALFYSPVLRGQKGCAAELRHSALVLQPAWELHATQIHIHRAGEMAGVTGKKADCSSRGPGISSQLSYSSVCNSSCKGSDTVFCPLWAAGGPTHIHLLMTMAKHLPCSLANVPMSTAVLHEVLNIEVYLIDNKWFPSVVSQQHTSDSPQR